MTLLLVCFFSFLAGFIDSVVGGGGLIQVPALFILYPSAPPAVLFGTNKISSLAGTTVAVSRFALNVKIKWKLVLSASFFAALFSFSGARLVSYVDPDILKPIILVLLVTVFFYTLTKKDLGSIHAPKLTARNEIILGILGGSALGFYDGFFGPGTGSFLIFLFVVVFGFSFLDSSASAKVVNWSTNFAATVYFVASGNVNYGIALPMAACNILGSFIGTKIALTKGSQFVRVLFLAVVSLLIIRYAYTLFG